MSIAHALALAALLAGSPNDPQPADSPTNEKKPTLAQLKAVDPSSKDAVTSLLLEVAREYKSYARVSDTASWAPELCRSPIREGVLESVSKDDSTHGRKLYFLFARDKSDYDAVGRSSYDKEKKPFVAAVGQVIVKESFKPVKVTDPKKIPQPPKPETPDPQQRERRGYTPVGPGSDKTETIELPDDHVVGANHELFRTGDPAGLFIMAKLADTEKPGTDAGWIYATVSADLKEVTAFGRIASCMECHTKTKHDRLFGPKWLQHRDARTGTNDSHSPDTPAASKQTAPDKR